ncbi:Arrestin domain-containing protein 3 [Geranomyces michiganensis]|nr:Arrestin domain-containing protein 3 [Geranomyces michiganensis]
MGVKPSISIDSYPTLLFPGQTLHGQVNVHGCKKKGVKAIRLECVGAVYYKPKQKIELAEIKADLQRPDRTAILLHKEEILADAVQGVKNIVLDQPFSFLIQPSPGRGDSLPSSFSNRYVAVVYFLCVTIERRWKADLTCFRAFHVACWTNVHHTLYKEPLLQSRYMDLVLMGLINKGNINARVSIPRGGYCKGDTIPIRMQINHLGDLKRITGVSVCLLRSVKWKRLDKGKDEAEPAPAVDGSPDAKEEAIRYKGHKIKPVGKVFKALNIKPGECNVDVTVDYYLDPLHKAEQKAAKTFSALAASTLIAPPRSPEPVQVALHHSDEFPWSSEPCVDALVHVSYELQVRLEIGSSENRGSTAIRDAAARRAVTESLAAAPAAGPAATDGALVLTATGTQAVKSPDVVTSVLDGALSGGTKLLEFTFPVLIGTVAHGDNEPIASAVNVIPSAPPPPVEKEVPQFEQPALPYAHSAHAASSSAITASSSADCADRARSGPSTPREKHALDGVDGDHVDHRLQPTNWNVPFFSAPPNSILQNKPLPSAPLLRASSLPEPALSSHPPSSSASSVSSGQSLPLAPALTSAASFPPALPPRRIIEPVNAAVGSSAVDEPAISLPSSVVFPDMDAAYGDAAPPPYTP